MFHKNWKHTNLANSTFSLNDRLISLLKIDGCLFFVETWLTFCYHSNFKFLTNAAPPSRQTLTLSALRIKNIHKSKIRSRKLRKKRKNSCKLSWTPLNFNHMQFLGTIKINSLPKNKYKSKKSLKMTSLEMRKKIFLKKKR